jgi:hypothetical protein
MFTHNLHCDHLVGDHSPVFENYNTSVPKRMLEVDKPHPSAHHDWARTKATRRRVAGGVTRSFDLASFSQYPFTQIVRFTPQRL